MAVAACVHPLVGRHGEADHLVQLTDGQAGDPDAVEQGHADHEHHLQQAGQYQPSKGVLRI